MGWIAAVPQNPPGFSWATTHRSCRRNLPIASSGVILSTRFSISQRRLMRWTAVMLAVGLPLGLLIGGAQPVAVGLVPAPWDKLAHAGVFAVLAAAIGVASGWRGWRMVLVAFVGAAVVGAADEWHQMFLPGRSAGLDDLAADCVGALLGCAALRRATRATPALPES
jgi:hypothetical protein